MITTIRLINTSIISKFSMDCHSGTQRLRAQSLGMAEMCGRLKGENLTLSSFYHHISRGPE